MPDIVLEVQPFSQGRQSCGAGDGGRALSRILAVAAMLAVLPGCSDPEERQPSAEEVQRYTAKIDRAEVEARAKAVEASRAEERERDENHLAQVPSQD